MISSIMLLVLKNSLFTSLLIGLLLLLVPLLQKKYRAKWRYVAWLVIAVKLLLPVNLSLPQAPLYIELPEQRTIATVTPPSDERPFVELFIPKEIANTPAPIVNNAEADVDFPNTIEISPLTIVGGVWFIGVLAFLLFQIASYQVFLRKLKTSHIQETPQPIKETIWRLGVDMGIVKLPEPVVTDAIDAPVLIGVLRPRILLPHTKYTDEEIAFILRHELVHYRRRDMWYKLVLLLANALHWFNPLVYIMTVQAAKDIELACDDDVIHGLDHATRARYGDTILSALPRKRRLEPVFSTHFGSTKQNMKYRLRNLFDMATKRRGIAALCAVIACALMITSFVTFGYAAAKSDSVQSTQESISDLMIHARANDGTWAAASSIEGKTWQKQIDEEIKWLEDAYKGYNTRFIITETLPRSEVANISRIKYLNENSNVFRNMSQMKNGAFTVENGQSFSRIGAEYDANMMRRTAVMVDNDRRLTVDINYTLTQGKLAVWLIDPDGKTVYQGNLQKAYQGAHTVSGKKGLWSVITVNEGNSDGSMSGNTSIVLRQSDQPQVASPNLSVQRIGQHSFKSGDSLDTSLQWNNSGNVMLLYTDKDYNDNEILLLMQGLPGIPAPDYSKVDQSKIGSIFNFSKSSTSPLVWNTEVKSGTYYFYLLQYGFKGVNKLTGEVTINKSNGYSSVIWQNEPNASSILASDSQTDNDTVFRLRNNNGKSITKSGSFEAQDGQTLIIANDISIKKGSVDLFLFAPSGKEQRFTFGDNTDANAKGEIKVPVSAGTWAYNCTGFFESGKAEIIGTLSDTAPVGMKINQSDSPDTGKSTAVDKAAYEVMQYSRSWVMVEYMLPYMTKDGIDAVVKLNNELNPNSLQLASARYILATPSKTESDKRSYTLMEKSGNWKYSSPLFPYMTNDGIDKVVALYNQKTGKNVKATDYYN